MSVYSEAGELIRREGWCQGKNHDREYGGYCVIGALRTVVEGEPTAWRRSQRTLDTLAEVELLARTDCLADWNDEPERTVDDVLALLDKAHRQETAA